MTKEIPEILLEAAHLFVQELDEHSQLFESLLADLGTGNSLKDETKLALCRERFHTIKGGAGFLGLEELASSAKRGEEILWLPELNQELVSELTEVINTLIHTLNNLQQDLV